MNNTQRNELEQAVLDAAASLGQLQVIDLQNLRRLRLAAENKAAAEQGFDDAEFEQAKADLAYAEARVRALAAKRSAKHFNSLYVSRVIVPLEEQRKLLWSVATSGDEELILKTARDYGFQMSQYWEFHRQAEGHKQRIADTGEKLRLAGEARKAALKKRGKARTALETAEQELLVASQFDTKSMKLFNHESFLADAAHQLVGTTGVAYSYVETSELGITIDDERLDQPVVFQPFTPKATKNEPDTLP